MTNNLPDTDQKIPDRLVKTKYLGEIDTMGRLDRKSRFGDFA